MKKISSGLLIALVFTISTSLTVYSQQKELDKLKSYIKKGKMDKAQEYCDKVTDGLSEKKSARFYGYLALGFYNDGDYVRAAENVESSNDFKLAAKLANEFANPKNDIYDIKTAAKLYTQGKQYSKASALLFEAGDYEKSAEVNDNPDSNLHYGLKLYDEGKKDEALHFFKRAKRKGKLFKEQKILDYYYNMNAYGTVYKIQDFNEEVFNMHIQGSVIDKMLAKGEDMTKIKSFLDSINIYGNKQDEAIIEGYVNNKMFDKAEKHVLSINGGMQKIALAFLSKVTIERYPDVSAWANFKLGKAYLCKNQITTYLIEEARKRNNKWEQEPIKKDLLDEYKKSTAESVKKCEKDYCEILKHAEKTCFNKGNDLAKDGGDFAEDYKKAAVFLKKAVGTFCK